MNLLKELPHQLFIHLIEYPFMEKDVGLIMQVVRAIFKPLIPIAVIIVALLWTGTVQADFKPKTYQTPDTFNATKVEEISCDDCFPSHYTYTFYANPIVQ